MMNMRFLKIVLLSLVIVQECSGINLIRDTEIELGLTEIIRPIFKVAGLSTDKAKVFVVDSSEINAFTIGHGYIFINSGLLFKFRDPLQLMAVVSHETAHIAKHHVDRLIKNVSNLHSNAALAMIAGAIGAILTQSEAALAASIGYVMAKERILLQYSRQDEASADELGASYLEKLGYDIKCMISVFEAFERMGRLNGGEHIPEYVKSHPISAVRISALKNRRHNKSGTSKKQKANAEIIAKYQRIINKLEIYKKPYIVPKDDYCKVIYNQNIGKLDEAIEIMQNLVNNNKKDLFYQEYLAQLYYQKGYIEQSVKIYRDIYPRLTDEHWLIKKDYAEVLIEASQNLNQAIRILEALKYKESYNTDIYRLLAKAYGKKGNLGISKYMLAWERTIIGDHRTAENLLKASLQELDRKTEQSYIKKANYLLELLKRQPSERIR